MLRKSIKCLQGCRTKIDRRTVSVRVFACMHVCVRMLIRLLSLVIGGTVYFFFFCPLLLHLIFRSAVELHLRSAQTLALKNLEKSVPLLQTQAASDASPAVKSSNRPLATARASSFVPGKFCNAAPSDQCKSLWHMKTKSVGTAQNKLNCRIKEHRQFS